MSHLYEDLGTVFRTLEKISRRTKTPILLLELSTMISQIFLGFKVLSYFSKHPHFALTWDLNAKRLLVLVLILWPEQIKVISNDSSSIKRKEKIICLIANSYLWVHKTYIGLYFRIHCKNQFCKAIRIWKSSNPNFNQSKDLVWRRPPYKTKIRGCKYYR